MAQKIIAFKTYVFSCSSYLVQNASFQDDNKWHDGSPVSYHGLRVSKKLNYSSKILQQRFKFDRPVETEGVYNSSMPSWKRHFLPEKNHNCTVLSFLDLTQPIWLSLPCDQKIFTNIVCVKEALGQEETYSTQPESRYQHCLHQFTKIDNSCFYFDWINSTLFERQKCSGDSKNFTSVFFAASHVRIPPIQTTSNSYIRFEKIFDSIRVTTHKMNTESVGAICVKRAEQVKIDPNLNTFLCSKNSFISPIYFCDETLQCVRDNGLCQCEKSHTMKMCKYFTSPEGSGVCGPLYNQTSDRHCEVFVEQKVEDEKQQSDKPQVLRCHNGRKLSVLQANDLLFDCLPDGEDEPLLLTLITGAYFSCEIHNQLQCRDCHSRCYNISEICVYTLNVAGLLEPCRAGEHMEECREFECNIMFKCAGFYCLPWKYVCDGRWDCPFGTDESKIKLCHKNRKCTLLYKCKQSEICIHLGNLCDGFFDCPGKEDERLCPLRDLRCPLNCECLTFAVFCKNITSEGWITEITPFWVLYVIETNLEQHFILFKCVKCHVINCNLTQLCQALQLGNQVQMLNVAFNIVSDIDAHCFQHCQHLKIADLSSNAISIIHSGLFGNLENLILVNLSSNPIKSFHANAFNSVPNLCFLSLKNLNVLRAQNDLFHKLPLKFLETNDFLMCCLVPNMTTCSAITPWFFSCADLLPTIVLKVIIFSVSIFILSVNTLCVAIVQISFVIAHRKGTEKTRAFSSNVSLVNISDIICCVPLFMLGTVDLIFQGRFASIASQWTSSSPCFSIFALFLFFSFLSPLVLSMFSLSRLQVVKYPMLTKFKKSKFVFSCNIPLFCASGLLSMMFTFLTWHIDVENRKAAIQTATCFPFVDPSDKMILVKVVTALSVSVQVFAVLFILIVYRKLFLSLKTSRAEIANAASKQFSNTALIVQIVVITCSNVLCWIPSSILYLVAMFMEQYPLQMMLWAVVIVYPFNSIVNPVVFIITTIRKICQ